MTTQPKERLWQKNKGRFYICNPGSSLSLTQPSTIRKIKALPKTLSPGEGGELISTDKKLLDSNVQFSTETIRHTKHQECMTHSKTKKSVSVRELMAGVQHKDSRAIVL